VALLASVGSAIMYLLRNRGNDGVDLLISHSNSVTTTDFTGGLSTIIIKWFIVLSFHG